jgi:hypothetical protein
VRREMEKGCEEQRDDGEREEEERREEGKVERKREIF